LRVFPACLGRRIRPYRAISHGALGAQCDLRGDGPGRRIPKAQFADDRPHAGQRHHPATDVQARGRLAVQHHLGRVPGIVGHLDRFAVERPCDSGRTGEKRWGEKRAPTQPCDVRLHGDPAARDVNVLREQQHPIGGHAELGNRLRRKTVHVPGGARRLENRCHEQHGNGQSAEPPEAPGPNVRTVSFLHDVWCFLDGYCSGENLLIGSRRVGTHSQAPQSRIERFATKQVDTGSPDTRCHSNIRFIQWFDNHDSSISSRLRPLVSGTFQITNRKAARLHTA